MLPPIGTLLAQDLQDRGRHILDTLQGPFPWRSNSTSCRTILAYSVWFDPMVRDIDRSRLS